MRKGSEESAREAVALGVPKKKTWVRPLVTCADVRDVTRGGINTMTDPMGGGMS
jgi:hypothetical protein